MPISLIPGKQQKSDVTSKIKTVIGPFEQYKPALIVLGVTLVLWIAVNAGNNILTNQLEDLSRRKQELNEEVQNPAVENLKTFAVSAGSVQDIIDTRNYPSSSFYPEFENTIHSEVQVNSLQVSLSSGEVSVSAEGNSFSDVAEQFLIWRNETSFVTSANLNSFSLNNRGKVNFSADLETNL